MVFELFTSAPTNLQCAAWRIDPSIRPLIHVNYLEHIDHVFFDIALPGLVIQSILAVGGYCWMYGLTRRSKLSVLAALPPFALNILHIGTHNLTAGLDVFVSSAPQEAKSALLTC